MISAQPALIWVPGASAAACAAGRALPSNSIAGFGVATASSDCAPWDGPALTIIFAPNPIPLDSIGPPYLRVSLWKERDLLMGREWRWPGKETIGGASLCRQGHSCQAATTGVVWLDRAATDSPVTGRLRLEFSGEPSIEGEFVAPVLDRLLRGNRPIPWRP